MAFAILLVLFALALVASLAFQLLVRSRTDRGCRRRSEPAKPLHPELDVEMASEFGADSVTGPTPPRRSPSPDRLVLMARDPYWLFSYWQLSPSTEMSVELRVGAERYVRGRRVLRLYDLDRQQTADYYPSEATDNWYFNPAAPGHRFRCELGLLENDGQFHTLLRSNEVTAPRDRPSDKEDPAWMPRARLWARVAFDGGTSPLGGHWWSAASPAHGMALWDRSG